MDMAAKQRAALAGAFLCLLAAPLVDQCLRPDSARDPSPELRAAAPAPERPRDLRSACAYPAAFESRHKDVFGLRDQLLRLRSVVHWFGLGLSPSPLVVRGDADWTYTTVDGSRDVWRGASPMTAEELSAWTDALRTRRAWVAAQGAEYVYAVAPNKEAIYPEHLPASWRRMDADAPTRLDQLRAALRHEEGLLLDLRPALLAARGADTPGDELYTRLGTHWNGRGAATAFDALARRLRLSQPQLPALDPAGLGRAYSPGAGDSWGPRMYLGDALVQPEWIPKPPDSPACEMNLLSLEPRRVMATRHADRKAGLRLLVFHDSFGPAVQPLLSKLLPFGLFVQSPRFDPDLVRAYKPDLVVDLHVERALVRTEHLQDIPYGRPAGRLGADAAARVVWRSSGPAGAGALEIPALALDPAAEWRIHLEGEAGTDAVVEIYPRGHGPRATREGKHGFAASGAFRHAVRLDPLDGEVRPLVRLLAADGARIDYAEIRRD